MLTPIGTVHSARNTVEDDGWDAIPTRITLAPGLGPEALAGLDAFSHVIVVYKMDRVEKTETGARHPRGNPEWPKVGIFAQRAKNRPNAIGVTVCRLDRVDGTTLHVTGLDAIDGSPVLDIKPWVVEFGPRGAIRQPRADGEPPHSCRLKQKRVQVLLDQTDQTRSGLVRARRREARLVSSRRNPAILSHF